MSKTYLVNESDLVAIADLIREKNGTIDTLTFPVDIKNALKELVGANFGVVAYASEDELPTTADENTIAAITTTPITGYLFSADEPANPIEGHLWISTGFKSNAAFNALKGNTLQVYPLSAKQYIGGAWVDKTTKIYQNGEWVDLITYLLLKNNQYTDITGGWTTSGFTYGSVGYAGSSASEDGVIINAESGLYCGVCTAKKIDFSKYRKIGFILSEWMNEPRVRFSTTANFGDASTGLVAAYTATMDDSGYGEIDISDVSESCYLTIMPNIASGTTLLSEVHVV